MNNEGKEMVTQEWQERTYRTQNLVKKLSLKFARTPENNYSRAFLF